MFYSHVLIVAAIVAYVQCGLMSSSDPAAVLAARQKCLADLDFNPEYLLRTRNAEFDIPKSKDYAFCFLKTMGNIEDDGTLKIDAIKTHIPSEMTEETASEILDDCKDLSGDSPLNSVALRYKCIVDKVNGELDLLV